MLLLPLPKVGKTAWRDADSILRTLDNEDLKQQAAWYFGCFRFSRTGHTRSLIVLSMTANACRSCRMHQICMLHRDQAESRTPPARADGNDCGCSTCRQSERTFQGCEDYPDENVYMNEMYTNDT